MSRFAIVGVVGSMAAACSSDAVRLSDTPFANPFAADQGAEPMATASVEQPVRPAPMPRSSVQSAPLAPPVSNVASAPAYNRPPLVEGVNPSARVAGMNPAASRPAAPARVAEAAPAPAARPAQGRLVSRSQIAEPKPAVAAARAPAEKAPSRPVQLAWQRGPEPAKIAEAPQPKAQIRPTQKAAAAPAKPSPAKVAANAESARSEPAKTELGRPAKGEPAEQKLAAAPQPKQVEPVKAAPVAAPPKVAAAEPAKPAREPESTASLPAQPAAPQAEFRWPARGRVISGFGGSGSNEGINIALPDGTPVKAAESGTVAYAGNEVKGYGNLVLIRHDNGYVSAYAHNGEIEVKRGQRVTRGQTIAKSGQSGNVTSPQLHFEIRKGSQPVDPMRYLASN